MTRVFTISNPEAFIDINANSALVFISCSARAKHRTCGVNARLGCRIARVVHKALVYVLAPAGGARDRIAVCTRALEPAHRINTRLGDVIASVVPEEAFVEVTRDSVGEERMKGSRTGADEGADGVSANVSAVVVTGRNAFVVVLADGPGGCVHATRVAPVTALHVIQ